MPDFDWVTARSKCSIMKVFNELRMGAENDVKTVNSVTHSGNEEQPLFLFRSNMVGDFFSLSQVDKPDRFVEFNCEMNHIKVTTREKVLKVTVVLNSQGKCKLRVDGGDELEQWQVQQVVLESFFFKPPF